MNSTRTWRRRWAIAVSVAAATIGLPVLAALSAPAAQAGPAPACPATGFKINAYQPVDSGVVKVARIAGKNAGQASRWELKLDAYACNKTTTTYVLKDVTMRHYDASGTLIRTVVRTPVAAGATVAPGADNQLMMVRDQTQYAFPLPSKIGFVYRFTHVGSSTVSSVGQSFQVAVDGDPGPLASYFFPARQSDLPAGHYWTQGRHAENSNYQRWAYDLGVVRWTGSAWDYYKAGSDHTKKESLNSWDRPIYAMSDGEIIGCNRQAPDNDPRYVDGSPTGPIAQGNVPGGNLLWIRSGNETTLYAHLKQNSIPEALCPFTGDGERKAGDPNQNLPGDAAYMVKAGQFLGRAGNSGHSTGGPHLHIHAFRGLPAIWGGSEGGFDADARPMQFVNVRTQANTSSNVGSTLWNELTSPALPNYDTRIEPNRCGFMPAAAAGKPEVVNAGVGGSCFLEMFNAMKQAGLRPVHIDVHGVGSSSSSTTVWRPADGTSWAMFAGLSAASLQSRVTQYVTNAGYRYLQLESYAEGGVVKYAVIFVKGQPGAAQLARWGQTASQFQSTFTTQTGAGYRPVNVSVAVVGTTRSYASLYEKVGVGSFQAKTAVPVSGYQAEFNAQVAAGRRPAYLDGYEVNGVPYLSVIFQSGLSGAYQATHAQTKANLLTLEASNLAANRLARGITEYTAGGVRNYAAIWRPAPDTQILTGPANGTASTVSVTFKSTTDTTATFECRLDAGAWSACTSGKSYTVGIGSHTISVRARDRQGLRDATPATRTWTRS